MFSDKSIDFGMMAENEELKEKKLRGSGGYIIAKISDDEQKKGNLGGPELFIAGIGRLPKDRISKYYCNKCEKDYPIPPEIVYENPNEQVGEDVVLIERGEYKCSTCKATISQYRKFNTDETESNDAKSKKKSLKTISSSKNKSGYRSSKDKTKTKILASSSETKRKLENTSTIPSNVTISQGKYFSLESIIGRPVYDNEAMLVGNVKEAGLRKSLDGSIQIALKINKSDEPRNNDNKSDNYSDEITWDNISKIGDIVLLHVDTSKKTGPDTVSSINTSKICPACGHRNEYDAMYCEECGKKY